MNDKLLLSLCLEFLLMSLWIYIWASIVISVQKYWTYFRFIFVSASFANEGRCSCQLNFVFSHYFLKYLEETHWRFFVNLMHYLLIKEGFLISGYWSIWSFIRTTFYELLVSGVNWDVDFFQYYIVIIIISRRVDYQGWREWCNWRYVSLILVGVMISSILLKGIC